MHFKLRIGLVTASTPGLQLGFNRMPHTLHVPSAFAFVVLSVVVVKLSALVSA